MVLDTFMFYNELDMLEFRLMELDHVVDKFIIVESTKTFVGNDKPLYFENNKKRFEKYLHKIHHVVLSNSPPWKECSTWARESHQRIATGEVLKYLSLKDDDIIIAGDVDEIPDSNEISKFKIHGLPFNVLTMLMQTYYFNFNHKIAAYSGYDIESKRNYHRTVACKVFTYGAFKELGLSVQKLRTHYTKYNRLWERGGWHLTFFMSDDLIKNKMENYSHTEFEGDINNLVNQKGMDFHKIKIEDNNYLPNNYKYWL